MKRTSFTTVIDATQEKVWNILWNDDTYSEWTAPFCEGSMALTNWQEGSKVLFLDGNGSGLVSVIEKKEPNRFLSFRHKGEVKNGVEDLDSAEAKACSGGVENYTLDNIEGKTSLRVDMDMFPGMEEYFLKSWPAALDKVKQLAESR